MNIFNLSNYVAYCLALLCLMPISLADQPARLKDSFRDSKHDQRRALRGDWKIADGIAECTQDDELYKKFKDHGPIIFYDLDYTDAKVSFSVKPDGAKTIVFTGNSEQGHVFRFILTERFLSVRAFPPDSKETSVSLAREDFPMKQGEWIPVVVTMKGTKATVKVGDFEKTYEHASLARSKNNLSIGFSFGRLSVKDLMVE